MNGAEYWFYIVLGVIGVPFFLALLALLVWGTVEQFRMNARLRRERRESDQLRRRDPEAWSTLEAERERRRDFDAGFAARVDW